MLSTRLIITEVEISLLHSTGTGTRVVVKVCYFLQMRKRESHTQKQSVVSSSNCAAELQLDGSTLPPLPKKKKKKQNRTKSTNSSRLLHNNNNNFGFFFFFLSFFLVQSNCAYGAQPPKPSFHFLYLSSQTTRKQSYNIPYFELLVGFLWPRASY